MVRDTGRLRISSDMIFNIDDDILKFDVNQKAIFSVNQKMDQLVGGKTDSVHG